MSALPAASPRRGRQKRTWPEMRADRSTIPHSKRPTPRSPASTTKIPNASFGPTGKRCVHGLDRTAKPYVFQIEAIRPGRRNPSVPRHPSRGPRHLRTLANSRRSFATANEDIANVLPMRPAASFSTASYADIIAANGPSTDARWMRAATLIASAGSAGLRGFWSAPVGAKADANCSMGSRE